MIAEVTKLMINKIIYGYKDMLHNEKFNEEKSDSNKKVRYRIRGAFNCESDRIDVKENKDMLMRK